MNVGAHLLVAGLALAPMLLATSTSPLAQGKQLDCSCTAEGEALEFPWTGGCLSEVSAFIDPIAGRCNAPGCIAEECRFVWSIFATSSCGEPDFFINGLVSPPPAGSGASWVYEPISGTLGSLSAGDIFRLGCDDSGSIAIGFLGLPYLELDFRCDHCIANN